MAHHAIEDLIEDTVRLIDTVDLPTATMRDYLAGLYRIQGFYDTGYTHFRLIDILLKYGFVYRIAADQYPGYNEKRVEVPGWMEDEETGELGYIQQEDGKPFVYVDAGSTSWERLCTAGMLPAGGCDPITPVPLSTLINRILQLCEQQGDKTLLNQWYGLVVTGYVDGTFDEHDGFGTTLQDLAKHDDIVSIREIALRNAVKRLRGADEALTLPLLADEVRLAGSVEKEYAVRFFLELKKSPDTLLASYAKALNAKRTGGNLLKELIDVRLEEGLKAQGWKKSTVNEKHIWCWYKDTASGRRFLRIIFEETDKFLMCHLGLQHRVLLGWQQRDADEDVTHVHFIQMAIASLPEARQEDTKFVHPYGGWKFDIGKSKKTLSGQIDHLLEDLETAETEYFRYLDAEFPDVFFQRDPERLLHVLEEGENGTGIVPTYVLFDSPYPILLSFTYYYGGQGNTDKADLMIDRLRKILSEKQRRSPYDTTYLEPFLEQYAEKGTAAALPPVYQHLLVKRLMRA